MTTIQVDLPEPLDRFVQTRVQEGSYADAAEYLRELVLADQKRKEQDRLEAWILEGLESGPGIPVTPEFWAEKRRVLIERFGDQSRKAE